MGRSRIHRGLLIASALIAGFIAHEPVFVAPPPAFAAPPVIWPGGVPATTAEPRSFATDARFVSPVLGGPVDGFRLQAGSPAIGRAAPVAGVTTDYAGVSRNATNPTMGAFEYATARYHLLAPQVTRAN